MAAFAALLAAGCTSGGDAAKQESAATNYFGPAGFGKLKPGMTKDEAVATGDLGASPVAVASGCDDYSFVDGPKPDPEKMAADAAVEKAYSDAVKAADELEAKVGPFPGPDASADEFAAHAQRSADSAAASSAVANAAAESTKRIADRIEAANASGGVSFGQGKLRLIGAPPAAKTAEGIGRGSTVAELKAAYESKGLTTKSEGRFELPVAEHAGWTLNFDVEKDKVIFLLLLNPDVRCS